MNQHYIPVFYLKHFTDPATPSGQKPYVWMFQGDKWKKKSPENIACRPDFYAFEDESGKINHLFEKYLQKLEDLIAPVLVKLSNGPPTTITSDERMMMSWFVISLQQRTPDFLNARAIEMERGIKERYRLLFESFKNDLQKFERFKATISENGNVENIDIDDVMPEKFAAWKVTPVKAFLLSELIKNWEGLAKMVFSMNWTMLYAEAPVFVTSESPVVTMVPGPNDGWIYGDLDHINVDVSLPLTPKLALMCGWRGSESYRLVKVTENDIRTLNLRTINSAADALSDKSDPLEIIAATPNFPFSDVVESVSLKRRSLTNQDETQ